MPSSRTNNTFRALWGEPERIVSANRVFSGWNSPSVKCTWYLNETENCRAMVFIMLFRSVGDEMVDGRSFVLSLCPALRIAAGEVKFEGCLCSSDCIP